MLETVLSGVIALVVGVSTTWLAVGGRQARIRATIREELDLIEHPKLGAEHRGRLERRVEKRLERYLFEPEPINEDRLDNLTLAIAAFAGGLAILVLADEDNMREMIFAGIVVGFAVPVLQAMLRAALRWALMRPPHPEPPEPVDPGTSPPADPDQPAQD